MASKRLALIFVVLLALGSVVYAGKFVTYWETYVTDYLDRTPLNRNYTTSWDKYDNITSYTFVGRNYSPFALPVSGSYLGGPQMAYFGPNRYAVNKVVLGSSVLKDLYAGKTYNEEMRVWTSLFTQ